MQRFILPGVELKLKKANGASVPVCKNDQTTGIYPYL